MVVGSVQSFNAFLPLIGSGLPSASTAAGGSAFGPAALLGGSTSDPAPGLYSALGRLAAVGRRVAPPPKTVQSAAEKKRLETLKAAAQKIADGDTRGGRDLARTVLDRNPRDVSALHLMGRSHLEERDYPAAERFIGRALALAPGSARLQSDFRNLQTLKKTDGEVLSVARRKLKSPAHRTEALNLLFHLVDRTDRRVETYLTLSDGFDAARRPVEALGALNLALEDASGDELNQVIQRAERIVGRFPRAALPHNVLGKALHRAGAFDRALRELKIAVNIAPENFGYIRDLADAHLGRSRRRLAAGNGEQARADVDAAFRIDPANAGLDEASARIAADQAKRHIDGGRYATALAELATAQSKAPGDASFREHLSGLYTRVAAHFSATGDDVQARVNYTKAYDLNNDNAVARRRMAELSFTEGLARLAAKEYDDAINLLERSHQAYPADTQYRQNLAVAYDARGQARLAAKETEEAIEDFRRGVSLDPANLSILTNLGNALNQS